MAEKSFGEVLLFSLKYVKLYLSHNFILFRVDTTGIGVSFYLRDKNCETNQFRDTLCGHSGLECPYFFAPCANDGKNREKTMLPPTARALAPLQGSWRAKRD